MFLVIFGCSTLLNTYTKLKEIMGHMHMAVLNYDILLTKKCNAYEKD